MIPVYQAEIDLGLEEVIRASASFGILAEPVLSEPTESEQKTFAKLVTADANPYQYDLYYIKSVLVSVGWNRNDDVFDYIDTWNARNTPVDKPFNYMHDMSDIIGHITSSIVVDPDGNLIGTDTPLDDVPEVFDIIVGSVLYKKWPDEEAQVRMDRIIAEIPTGKWKVSMECLFKNFDYAVVSPAGENKVIKRTEGSAFLTKHLKAFGGTGEYEGHRIGRLLRNFAFSGKGLVDRPANPRSDVVGYSDKTETNLFVSASEAQVNELSQEDEINMSVTYTQEQYDFLKEELDSVKAENVDLKEKATLLQKQINDKDVTYAAEKEDAMKQAQAENAEALQEKDEQIADLTSKLEKSEADLQEATTKLADIEAETAKAARLARIMERDVTEEKAQSLIEKFADVSDEMFEELVSALPEKVEAEETEDEEDASAEDQSAANEAEEELEDSEVNDDESGDAANASEEDSDDKLFKSVAGWIGSNLRSTAKLEK